VDEAEGGAGEDIMGEEHGTSVLGSHSPCTFNHHRLQL
jgi:hypothetical protein